MTAKIEKWARKLTKDSIKCGEKDTGVGLEAMTGLTKRIEEAVKVFRDEKICPHGGYDEWAQDCSICLTDFAHEQVLAQIRRDGKIAEAWITEKLSEQAGPAEFWTDYGHRGASKGIAAAILAQIGER